jgi:hypothetical protein
METLRNYRVCRVVGDSDALAYAQHRTTARRAVLDRNTNLGERLIRDCDSSGRLEGALYSCFRPSTGLLVAAFHTTPEMVNAMMPNSAATGIP